MPIWKFYRGTDNPPRHGCTANTSAPARTIPCQALAVCLGLVLAAGSLPAQQQTSRAANDDFQYAEKLARDNYPDLAVEQYKVFIERYPGDPRVPEAWRRMGEGHLAQNAFAAAREAFETLLLRYSRMPVATDALFQIARAWEAEGERAEAAQHYERFAIQHPSLPLGGEAGLRAGRLYLEAGERVRGRKLLRDVIDRFPGNPELQSGAHLGLLEDMLQTGEFERAFRQTELFLSRFSEITAAPRVWLLKAEIQQNLGHLLEARQTLATVRERFPDSAESQRAAFEEAKLAAMLGDDSAALFESARTGRNDSLAAIAVIAEAGLYLERGENEAAIQILNSIRTPGQLAFEQRLQLGRLYFQLESWESAGRQFAALQQDLPPEADSLRGLALLYAARCAFATKDAPAAVAALRRLERLRVPSTFAAEAQFVRGSLMLEVEEDPAGASRAFSRFLDTWPEHPAAHEAQARLATAYELLADWPLAHAEWRRYLAAYPSGPHFSRAREHIAAIRAYLMPDYADLVDGLADASGIGSRSGASALDRAKLHMHFRNYARAIPLLKTAISEGGELQTRAEAWAILGKAYFIRGEITALQDRKQAAAWYDSAKVTLRHVRSSYRDAAPSKEIDRMLGTLVLRGVIPRGQLSLDTLSLRYADDPDFHELHLSALRAKFRTSAADSGQIEQRLKSVMRSQDPALRAEAGVLLSRLWLGQGQTNAAVELLQGIADNPEGGPAALSAKLLLAKVLALGNELDSARSLLVEIRTRHAYSPLADSARLAEARLMRAQGDYRSMARLLQKSRMGSGFPTAMHAKSDQWQVDRMLGEAKHALGETGPAMQAWLRVARMAPDAGVRSGALLQLGKAAEELLANQLAERYYRTSLAQARNDVQRSTAGLALARLALETGRFGEARRLARESNAVAASAPEAGSLAIIAAIRDGRHAAVRDEIKQFEKAHESRSDLLAEIQFELGDRLLQEKAFKRADKVFKDLRKKYKGTPYAIQGDFGYGKSLLLQNKPEDALDVLTEIPGKYPGDPFLRVVFLNLGDFYMAQKQLDNAAAALKRAIVDTVYDSTHKFALRKLATLYDEFGYTDVALGYARRYIDLFPFDDQQLDVGMKVGEYLRRLKRYEAAREHYRRIAPLADAQDGLSIKYFIAETYFDEGAFELAIVEFMKLRYDETESKLPWRATAIFKAGEAYIRLNKLQKARDQFDFLVRLEGAGSRFGQFAMQKIVEIDRISAANGASSPKS